MNRYLNKFLIKDLNKKILLVTGPRQAGKTTLSKSLVEHFVYLNYDSAKDRIMITQEKWDRSQSLVIFDELHKMKNWKRWLKGVFDTEGLSPGLLVTGSAKLDAYKKVGDSLAGRYFQFRLHPIDVKEAIQYGNISAEDAFNRILTMSGFPEPFFENDPAFYGRWRPTHLDIILRQDLLDLESVQDIQSIETLIELLRSRVGSTISYANLARDLNKSESTIKRWLTHLENMYIVFKVLPYQNNISKSLKKAPKYYFYNTADVMGDTGTKLENLVACALLKELHFINDIKGVKGHLHYCRTKDGKEVDFLIVKENRPTHLLEVKWADTSISKGLTYFSKQLPEPVERIQLVKELSRAYSTKDGIKCASVIKWLSQLDLS